MPRILLIIDQIHTGGAEKILLDFRKYLLSKGHIVEVYSLYFSSPEYTFGCHKNCTNIFLKAFQQLKIYINIRRYIKKYQPDYIYSFLDRSNILTALLPQKYKKCLSVHNVLSIQYSKLSTRLFKIVKKLIETTYNRHGNIIIAVSEQVKTDLIKNFNIKNNLIRVINNYTDKSYIIKRSEEDINEIKLDKNYKYILNIGRLSKQKAQWKLLKALKYLHTTFPNTKIKLIILGEGDLKTDLLRLSKLLKLNDLVYILPFNSNPFKFIKQVDLFVLPSIFEGCPIILSEVIALEVPFIGSQKAVPKELFGKTISAWNNSTYYNINLNPDFTPLIFQDDIDLANLIYNHLYSKDINDYIIACQEWNKYNDKKHQFNAYLRLFNISNKRY